MFHRDQGFTIIEVAVRVAVLGLLGGLVVLLAHVL